jgi:hypothetical protein
MWLQAFRQPLKPKQITRKKVIMLFPLTGQHEAAKLGYPRCFMLFFMRYFSSLATARR